MSPQLKKIIVAFLAFLTTVLGTLVAEDGSIPDGSPDSGKTVVVSKPTVPGAPTSTKPDTVELGGPGEDKIKLNTEAQTIIQEEAKKDAVDAPSSETDLHENAVPQPSVQDFNANQKPPDQPTIPKNTTQATPSTPGCTTALVRNYSSRNGAPILLGVIHWTGSRPTIGSSAGGLAIVRWFDTPAAQASSNYITDQDGRCWLVVPESQKSWTQAGFNPWSVSVEIINQGVQPLFQTKKARQAVIRLMRGWHKRWKLPYRRARISGCRVTRSGFLAHRDLGPCGGGHPDVGTFALDKLIQEAKSGSCGAKCQRRKRHAAVHRHIRNLKCSAPNKHPNACEKYRAENRRLHKAGI